MEIIMIVFIMAVNCGESDPSCENTEAAGARPSMQTGSLSQSPVDIKKRQNVLDN